METENGFLNNPSSKHASFIFLPCGEKERRLVVCMYVHILLTYSINIETTVSLIIKKSQNSRTVLGDVKLESQLLVKIELLKNIYLNFMLFLLLYRLLSVAITISPVLMN